MKTKSLISTLFFGPIKCDLLRRRTPPLLLSIISCHPCIEADDDGNDVQQQMNLMHE